MTWEQNYLAHYGIKGQQWGLRRFQNEDGSLTEEGKARYLKDLDSKRKEIYEDLDEKSKKQLHSDLENGLSFDESIKKQMQQVRSQAYKNSMIKRASGFLRGYGINLIGNLFISSSSHPILSAVVRGYGKGVMIGNLAGAAVRTGNDFILKDTIANASMDEIYEIYNADKKKS